MQFSSTSASMRLCGKSVKKCTFLFILSLFASLNFISDLQKLYTIQKHVSVFSQWGICINQSKNETKLAISETRVDLFMLKMCTVLYVWVYCHRFKIVSVLFVCFFCFVLIYLFEHDIFTFMLCLCVEKCDK